MTADIIFEILEKIFFLILLIGCGILARRFKLLGEEGEKTLSRLLVDLFWPASIYVSITGSLTAEDITGNILLPVSALITAFTGLGLALLFVKFFRYADDEKKIFLYHSSINNFVFMVIPFATLFLGARGVGLLYLHNLGYIIFLWTVDVSVMKDKKEESSIFKRLLTPGLISTILAVITVFIVDAVTAGVTRENLPKFLTTSSSFIFSVIDALSKPLLVSAMIITGSRIYVLGLKSLRFNMWNINLGLIRLILVPGILFILTLLLHGHVRDDILIIFMLVNVMPVSVNSIGMAHRYNTSTELAAQGVVFTHLFGILTMAVFITLIQGFFGL